MDKLNPLEWCHGYKWHSRMWVRKVLEMTMISEISSQMMRLLILESREETQNKGRSDYRTEVKRLSKNVPWIRI